jgi:Chaperone of endosialidase
LGTSAGQNLTTGNRNIDIGNLGVANEGNTIRIGTTGDQSATYIAGIAGQTVGAGGSTCYVDNDGKLGVFLSAHRFKTDIADMATASEAILALRPVTFHYKPELDKTGIPQFGLVAEEVEAINPDLVTRDKEGKVTTVRYEAVNAMLLNEFLKEHRKNQRQEATIARLEKQIEVLAEGLQKVSAELESADHAQQVAFNR